MKDVYLKQRADFDVMHKGNGLGSVTQWIDDGRWTAIAKGRTGHIFGLGDYKSMEEAKDAVVSWHEEQKKM